MGAGQNGCQNMKAHLAAVMAVAGIQSLDGAQVRVVVKKHIRLLLLGDAFDPTLTTSA